MSLNQADKLLNIIHPSGPPPSAPSQPSAPAPSAPAMSGPHIPATINQPSSNWTRSGSLAQSSMGTVHAGPTAPTPIPNMNYFVQPAQEMYGGNGQLSHINAAATRLDSLFQTLENPGMNISGPGMLSQFATNLNSEGLTELYGSLHELHGLADQMNSFAQNPQWNGNTVKLINDTYRTASRISQYLPNMSSDQQEQLMNPQVSNSFKPNPNSVNQQPVQAHSFDLGKASTSAYEVYKGYQVASGGWSKLFGAGTEAGAEGAEVAGAAAEGAEVAEAAGTVIAGIAIAPEVIAGAAVLAGAAAVGIGAYELYQALGGQSNSFFDSASGALKNAKGLFDSLLP